MSATNPLLIRIAVLECLEFANNIREKKGTFTDVFHIWLKKSEKQYNSKRLSSRKIEISTTGFDAVSGNYPDNLDQDFDAIIVTGSMDAAYEDEEKSWIKRLGEYIQGRLLERSAEKTLKSLLMADQLLRCLR